MTKIETGSVQKHVFLTYGSQTHLFLLLQKNISLLLDVREIGLVGLDA